MTRLVYFARRVDGEGPIKIGCSIDVESRLYQLGVDYRASYVPLATAPGDFLTERNVHLKFAAHRVDLGIDKPGATEWFAPAPKLLAFIDKVNALGKLPLSKSDQRQWVFAERYLAGETLQQIADDHGLTRERVRQVLRRIGVPSLGLRPEHCAKPHDLTADEIAAAKEYAAGALPKNLCARYGLGRYQLLSAVRRLDLQVRKPGAPFKQDPRFAEARVTALYQRGVSTKAIAEEMGWSHSTYVYRWLKRAGVKPRTNKGRRPMKAAA